MALRLSDGKGTVCCQASLQRASLHRLRGEDDQARGLYRQAEKLGSPYAKTQVSDSIVKEFLRKTSYRRVTFTNRPRSLALLTLRLRLAKEVLIKNQARDLYKQAEKLRRLAKEFISNSNVY